jgi:hypothetical protein
MQAKDILHRANITLQDTGFVRWPLPELLLYLNDGMRELAIYKPTAVTETVELPLSEGTLQAIPDAYISLLRVTRNLATLDGSPQGRTGGKAITPTSRNTLDVVMPSWQDPNTLPYSATVQHVIQDMADPRSFYVVPGNDGNGVIEAVVSVEPTDIAEPANPLDVGSYTATVAVPSIFRNALVDYVISRAYQKDSTDPNAAARAQAHYQMFANAIGLKMQTDQAASVKTTGATA